MKYVSLSRGYTKQQAQHFIEKVGWSLGYNLAELTNDLRKGKSVRTKLYCAAKEVQLLYQHAKADGVLHHFRKGLADGFDTIRQNNQPSI